jgi:hypothetical protein
MSFNEAIKCWRGAAARERRQGNAGMAHICENAARELEIERDTGEIVHLTPRIGGKK